MTNITTHLDIVREMRKSVSNGLEIWIIGRMVKLFEFHLDFFTKLCVNDAKKCTRHKQPIDRQYMPYVLENFR